MMLRGLVTTVRAAARQLHLPRLAFLHYRFIQPRFVTLCIAYCMSRVVTER